MTFFTKNSPIFLFLSKINNSNVYFRAFFMLYTNLKTSCRALAFVWCANCDILWKNKFSLIFDPCIKKFFKFFFLMTAHQTKSSTPNEISFWTNIDWLLAWFRSGPSKIEKMLFFTILEGTLNKKSPNCHFNLNVNISNTKKINFS